ncbi:MAG: B12-binding domain-containing protein [Phycisphaerales bacterium]|nr:MAG: B12-binding domain-containing protein [Phycisphaerales bacterium]
MNQELVIEQLFALLVSGDRPAARQLVDETLAEGVRPEELAHDVFWPVVEMVNSLYRADQLTNLAHHYASRLLRSLVDQIQTCYEQRPRRSRSVLMFCGASEGDELEAQLVADLAEADGYDITFGGGGIAGDEILAEIGSRHPDILLMFASSAADLPTIRKLIDTIREIGACPGLQVVVGGGVFNRADGLAEEIGADLWVKKPQELLQRLVEEKGRRATPEQRTVGRNRRVLRLDAA